jgi:hypothetical protein
MAREIIKDTEIDGYPFQQGEMVMLAFGAANRDPAMFPDANRVIVDREVNRHAAFGLGIHRCIGSTLARMEMRVALEQWLGKFPDFALTPGAAVKWSAGTVRGPRQLPITLGPRRQRPKLVSLHNRKRRWPIRVPMRRYPVAMFSAEPPRLPRRDCRLAAKCMRRAAEPG